MLNSNSLFASGSYNDLRKHILQRLRSTNINNQVFEVIRIAYGEILREDNIFLSRIDKVRLLAKVLKTVLAEMNEKLDQR